MFDILKIKSFHTHHLFINFPNLSILGEEHNVPTQHPPGAASISPYKDPVDWQSGKAERIMIITNHFINLQFSPSIVTVWVMMPGRV